MSLESIGRRHIDQRASGVEVIGRLLDLGTRSTCTANADRALLALAGGVERALAGDRI